MSAKKLPDQIPPDKLALYEKLVATNPSVERKGTALPYTSLNGHMFSFLSPTGTLAIRLPVNEREVFLKKYKTALMEAHGTIMKEYVAVPENLFEKTENLKAYFNASYDYIKTLKPKATKKIKPATKKSK
ncbi:MAG: hypothetical protein H7122_19655 [Chitinophagaceae bacterium]|nr:hypothetical protein [Chitinophagaceae bacterium]